MSAVAGVFTAFTTVNSRSVARIVVEVPIEQADAALAALGGFPKPAESRWVGIAPLVAEPAATVPAPAQEPPAAEKVTRLHDRQPWSALSRAQQSGIRCGDPDFQAFIRDRYPTWEDCDGPRRAADVVRHLCNVISRAELDGSAIAGERWDRLDAEYRDWQRQQQTEARYADTRR